MEDPKEDPLMVHCFCVHSSAALLGVLLGVSRSWNVIFCLSCRFILGFSCVYSSVYRLVRVTFCIVVFYYMFMCVSCFGLVVSTCHVIG